MSAAPEEYEEPEPLVKFKPESEPKNVDEPKPNKKPKDHKIEGK